MVLGATHYRWHPKVQAVVERIERRYPQVQCNTYEDHPWPGWDAFSIDCWGPEGRGDAIAAGDGVRVLEFVLAMRRKPQLRHWIYLNTLWTSFGGKSIWTPDDHRGSLRHVHFTFWRF